MIPSSVLFPDPFGPSITVIVPGSSVSVTSITARIAEKLLLTWESSTCTAAELTVPDARSMTLAGKGAAAARSSMLRLPA